MHPLRTGLIAGVAYKAGQNNDKNKYPPQPTMYPPAIPAHACNCPYCPGNTRQMQPAYQQAPPYSAPPYGDRR